MEQFLLHRKNALGDILEDTIENWIGNMLSYLGGEIWLNKSQNVDHPTVINLMYVVLINEKLLL